jgi:hypothetical protein
LVPLKERARPYLPAFVRVAPTIVPVLPLPEASMTVVPLASLNEYAATKPEVGGVGVGGFTTIVAVADFVASATLVARTVTV